MPGSTPVYGIPYQSASDSPNGPTLGQDLAGTVETELTRMDTAQVVFSATASGNFVKPTSPPARTHIVELWGPAGAGGGVTSAAGQGEGGGGGGGAYCRKVYADSALSASEAFVIGTGGTGVSGGDGNNGSAASTFKSLSAGAGTGGKSMVAGSTDAGANMGVGGTATGGDLNIAGGDGGKGRRQGTFVFLNNFGGPAGGPGGTLAQHTDFGAHAGTAGHAPGGGGSGAYGSSGVQTGGAGAAGKIVVTSIY